MSVLTCSVESKSFQVHFVGENRGSQLSLSEHSHGTSFPFGFEKEEIEWLLDNLKKVLNMNSPASFNSKYEG